MRSQIYGILGLMYTLAIGILLVVALVGTSKQFAWKSSAPLYKFSMIELSSNVQKVKTFLSEERVYAADKALFYVGAFGGYSTISDMSPKFDAKMCGCPSGSKLININGDSCSSTDKECYCENTSTGGFVQPNMCFGSGLDVKMLDKSFWTYIPEKYFVYWYNGTNEIPPKKKIKETAEEYLNSLFPIPDPIISIPLELLGVKMDFKYITKIDDFSDKYVDVEWIPIGENSLIFNFPFNHPFIEYMMKLAMKTKVKNNLFALYKKSANFVKNKKFNSVFNNPSKGILPIVIDENYVVNYTKEELGTYYCNYSTSDRPDGNPKCSVNSVNVNNLQPMVALVYYIDKNYWDTSPTYNTSNMGSNCSSCSSKPDYLSLNENDLEGSLPCTAEINSTIKDGYVVFRIDKFYGCQKNGNLNTNLTCMMCAIVSEINKDIGGQIKNTYTLQHSSWEYENSLSDKNYAIKMVPLEKFNISLNSIDTKTHVWKNKTFSAWITPPYNYLMNGSSGCNHIVKGGQVGADSICELNGFQKAEDCRSESPVNAVNWGYNVTKYPRTINCPSGFKKIDYIVCNNASGNTEINLNSKYGISVCGNETTSSTSGWINGSLLNQLKNNNVDGPILKKLGYACNVMGKELTGIHVKKETNHNITSPYLYSSSGTINNPIGGDVGAVLNITCKNEGNGGNEYTYNLSKTPLENSTYSRRHMLGFDYSGLTGNFNNTKDAKKFAKIYNYYKAAYGGNGSNIAFVFCRLYCGESCIPCSMWVTNDSSYSNKYAGYGRLNLNISSNSEFTYTYAIDEINCSSTIWPISSSSEIGFNSVVGINLTDVPLSFVDIYTPKNFANQTIVLKRICLENNGELLTVHFNDNGDTPGLLIDPGLNESTIQNVPSNSWKLSKIKCVIK